MSGDVKDLRRREAVFELVQKCRWGKKIQLLLAREQEQSGCLGRAVVIGFRHNGDKAAK